MADSPLLLLASGSPRRHEILNQLRIAHRVVHIPAPAGEDEPQLAGERPQDYVKRTAREKALRANGWLLHPGADELPPRHGVWILCADTTVILDDNVLGKPDGAADAARMLALLSGRSHEVHTAVAVYHDGRLSEAVSVSHVRFKMLSQQDIQHYCSTGDYAGKAGAYGIQGPAAAFVTHLSGSYTGVMGLPAYDTVELLRAAGFPSPETQ